MTKGKRITIQLADGSTVTAKVLYSSGDNVTAQVTNGTVYEVDRNVRNDDGAYIAL